MTLTNYIEEQKCRKGASDGITKKGAFWIAAQVKIRDYGRDGIGNNESDKVHFLQLRHYRSGETSAVIHYHSWHQNYGHTNSYHNVDLVLDCETVEEVIAELKGVSINGAHAFSEYCREGLEGLLGELGMPLSHPSPDDE